MSIADSGNRRQFDTGAVRDIQEGKGRCDLLPLDIIAELYGYNSNLDAAVIFENIAKFKETNDVKYLYKTLMVFFDGIAFDNVPTAILEVAKHFEEGAKKYGEYNWQKGIPTRCYIDSAVRHYLKWLRGDKDEPHDRAFVWNILCLMWTVRHIKPGEEKLTAKHSNLCVCCGDEIPEGRHVCPSCEKRAQEVSKCHTDV